VSQLKGGLVNELKLIPSFRGVGSGPGSTAGLSISLAGNPTGATLTCPGGLTRNAVAGMASFDVEPRSLGRRIASGICPPSKPARILCEPARDFCPLSPRPE